MYLNNNIKNDNIFRLYNILGFFASNFAMFIAMMGICPK